MSSPELKPAGAPPLRMSIAHLLMLMVAFSLTFAIVRYNLSNRATADPLDESFESFRRRAIVMEITQAALIAVALAGAAASLVALRCGQIGRLAPGHVMLLIEGPSGLLMLVASIFNDSPSYAMTSDAQVATVALA